MSVGNRAKPGLPAVQRSNLGLGKVDKLLGVARYFMRKGLAPSTLKSYDAAWNGYVTFCSGVSVSPCPVNIAVLCAFISERVLIKDMQFSSISVLVAGIQFHARCRDPSAGSLFSNPSVRLLLNGIKRSKPMRRDSRLPPSTTSLYSMVNQLRRGRFGSFLDKMLEAVLLVAFFGFLRIGEFSTASRIFDPNRNLRIADVTFHDSLLSIMLRMSKTDKEGNGSAVSIARTNTVSVLLLPCLLTSLPGTLCRPTSLCSSPAQVFP